jgi:hypothetical protein
MVERWKIIDGGNAIEATETFDDPGAFNACLYISRKPCLSGVSHRGGVLFRTSLMPSISVWVGNTSGCVESLLGP